MKNSQNIRLLLTPSWVVNLMGGALAILVPAAVIVFTQYRGSAVQLQIFEAQQANVTSGAEANYQDVAANIADMQFIGALPLLLTWAAVGLVVYFLAISIARAIGNIMSMRNQMNYMHVSKQQLLHDTLTRLGLRICAIVFWLLMVQLTLGIFVPYALASANVAGQSLSIQSAGYAVLAAAVLYGTIYINAVSLRLIALRPRLFSSVIGD